MVKHNCENCKYLRLVNRYPIYGVCDSWGLVLKLWDMDARNIRCANWEHNPGEKILASQQMLSELAEDGLI